MQAYISVQQKLLVYVRNAACGHHLWFYLRGRLGRVENATHRIGAFSSLSPLPPPPPATPRWFPSHFNSSQLLDFSKIQQSDHSSKNIRAPDRETSFFCQLTNRFCGDKAFKFFSLIVALNKLSNFPLKCRRSYQDWARLFPWLFSAAWR